MKTLIKYILLVFLILVAISGTVALFESPLSPKTEVSLSILVSQINTGEVKDIAVRGDGLEITLLKDGVKEYAKKETGVSAVETLLNLGVDKNALNKIGVNVRNESGFSLFALNFLPAILPVIIIFVIFWFMFRQAQKGSGQVFSFTNSKAKLAVPSENGKKITFKDVAGLKEAKSEVKEVVDFLKNPDKYRKLGARIPRGILLVGSPGTGKTLLAKAIANEAVVPFYYVSGSEFVELFVGVGANRVRDTFQMAKKTAPSIIFIDEIDAVGRHRGAGLGGGHDEREQTLNQILVEMDGFSSEETVIVVAATNRPDILDPALLRPGRFDRRIVLDEPSMFDREEILKLHALDKPLAKDVNLKVVAERTPGLSGADLANLINEAAILAASQNRETILQIDILQSIEKVLLGPERKSHVFSKKEKEIAAYHEAGHALVAASLPYTDPVHKVSIISRGRAGGYTLKLPSEDKHLKSRSELRSELAVLLGGYGAEQVVFDELTTGASNDLRIASDLARSMVTKFGMSDKLGPVTFGERDDLIFLGKEITAGKNYSETTAYQIDREVSKFIAKGLKAARNILTTKMTVLKRIAAKLIEQETLEQKEFYALLKG